MPYRSFVKSGVRLLRETVSAIDPVTRRVTTDRGTYEADFLIVALGADYDMDATPGLAEVNEFYSVAGAERLREVLPTFTSGKALIGVCGAPYKCPPAPSECALMLHDYLVNRGVREACEIRFVLPLPSPVPPSPETSRALVAAFKERNIEFIPGRRVASIDPRRKIATLDDGAELPFDLFLGVPKHRAPAWWWRPAWPKTAGFRSIRGHWRPNIPASTQWEMAPTRAPRRPACSPKGLRARLRAS